MKTYYANKLYRLEVMAIALIGLVLWLPINVAFAQPNGFTNTFEYGNGTTYGQTQCRNDVGHCKYWINSQNSDVQDRNLRIRFQKGVYGVKCGIQGRSELSGNRTYTLTYQLKFDNGFDWRLGGKLPGLAGGSAPSGGGRPTDGKGFSTRYMWRQNGRLVVYAYYKDQTNYYGDDWDVGVTFNAGQWYTLKQTVTVNTGNNANGRVEVWVNGTKRMDKTGLRLMSQGNTVNSVYFDTFMGGNDASWGPNHTQYLRMDNFKCVKGRDDGGQGSVTEGSVEIEKNYTIVNETGTKGTVGPDNFNPGASGGQFVRLFDTGDKLYTTFNAAEAGNYQLRLRLRVGYASDNPTGLANSYVMKVDGTTRTFKIDQNSVSSLDKDTYWGELTFSGNFSKGNHTVSIEAKSDWLKADRLKFKKVGGSNPPGECNVTIRAAGQTGEEVIRLLINDQFGYQWAVTSTSLVNYTAKVPNGGNIKVRFHNDGKTSNGQDKNVRIDRITFGGVTVESESVARTGCGERDWLYCEGHFDFGTMGCNASRFMVINEASQAPNTLLNTNPVQNGLARIDGGSENYKMIIYKPNGQAIWSQSGLSGVAEVGVGHWPKGVYVVKVISEQSPKAVKASKLVIN